MGSVLHRTTGEYRTSVHTPDYSSEDWIINPNMSAVSSVNSKYWKIVGDNVSEMSQSEKDTQDASDLPAYKTIRYAEIDQKTDELIAQGFSYDSQTFSLSVAAQTNFNTLKNQESAFTWPVDITTKDENTYSLAQANLTAFWATGAGTVKTHLDSGRVLKKSIFDAADQAAVDTIVDSR
jgi:hypothetical protein